MHKALHPKDDIVSRKEGVRGLVRTEDRVDTSIRRLEDHIEKRRGRLITATRNNTNRTRINRPRITRKQKCEEKQLYGSFKRLTNDISNEKNVDLAKKREPYERK